MGLVGAAGTMLARADLAVAGAGIVGLGVALEGVRRGLRVVVVEQDARPNGASIRNFGHGCVTAQTGLARRYGRAARERWLHLRDEAGLWVEETGTVVIARSDEELAVLSEFVIDNPDDASLLTPREVLGRVPVSGSDLVGGAFLHQDLRVDPRQAVPALASHLAANGVEFLMGTSALSAETGVLHTSSGDITAPAIVLAPGHQLGRLLPEETAAAGVVECQLHMLRIASPAAAVFTPAVLTGTSMLRYSGFLACPSSATLRARLGQEHPALIAAGVNLMLTQAPDGDLIVGDTHVYGQTPMPFASEELDELILAEMRRLLGTSELRVRERWLGTYASAPDREYLLTSPTPGVRGVVVTSGIGMTTGLGLAPDVLDGLGP